MSLRIQLGELTADDIPELRELLAGLEASLVPAKDAEVVVELEKLFAHYPQTDMPENTMKSRWRDWLEDLQDVPLDVLRAGCRDWRRSPVRWAPTPGQFIETMAPYFGPRKHSLSLARYALKLLEAA